jgi:hypothetical protein
VSTLRTNTFQNVSGNTIFTASNDSLHLPAGSTSIAPLKFTSGSQLSAVQASAIEYDGDALFFTPDSSAVGGRAFVQTPHYYKLPSTRTLVNDLSVQSLFGVGVTLASATTYQFEINTVVSSTGAANNGLQFSLGGTAVLTGVEYWATTTNGTAAGTPNTASSTYFAVSTASTICAAVAAATARVINIKGNVRVTTSGTFVPQVQYITTAPGAAPTVSTGSYIKISPIGTNSVSTIGAWA